MKYTMIILVGFALIFLAYSMWLLQQDTQVTLIPAPLDCAVCQQTYVYTCQDGREIGWTNPTISRHYAENMCRLGAK